MPRAEERKERRKREGALNTFRLSTFPYSRLTLTETVSPNRFPLEPQRFSVGTPTASLPAVTNPLETLPTDLLPPVRWLTRGYMVLSLDRWSGQSFNGPL